MANIASAAKRARQSAHRTARNRTLKTNVRTIRKQVLAAVEAKDKKTAESSLSEFNSAVDKASKTNAIHRNAAARFKSSLAKQVAGL